MLEPNDKAAVMNVIRKVFTAATITIEQEKRILSTLSKASTKDVALDAVDRMWNEGVRYPTGLDIRNAIDAEHRRLAQQQQRTTYAVPPCCSGSFDAIGFKHWWTSHASEQSKAEARRAAKGLDVMARWVKAAEA